VDLFNLFASDYSLIQTWNTSASFMDHQALVPHPKLTNFEI